MTLPVLRDLAFYDLPWGAGRLGFAVLLALAACAPDQQSGAEQFFAQRSATSALAEYRDPLAGLHRVGAESVPADALVLITGTTALVASENVARALARSDPRADPTYLIHGAVALLRREIPRLVLRSDLASARDEETEVTLVLDIRADGPDAAGGMSRAEVMVLAFDGQMRPLSRWSASGSATVAESGATDSFRLASDRALMVFRDKVGEFLLGLGG